MADESLVHLAVEPFDWLEDADGRRELHLRLAQLSSERTSAPQRQDVISQPRQGKQGGNGADDSSKHGCADYECSLTNGAPGCRGQILLVAERLDGVESRGLPRRVDTEEQTYGAGDSEADDGP